MSKQYRILFNSQTIQEVNLPLGKEMDVLDTGNTLIIKKKTEQTQTQTFSLRWFFVPTFVATLFFFAYFSVKKVRYIPLTGNHSIASLTFVLGLLLGIISFTISFILHRKKNTSSFAQNIYWRNFPTIVFSFATMLGLILMAVFWLIGKIFIGAAFDLYTASFLFFLFTGIVNYTMLYFSITLSPEKMMHLLIAVIIGGAGFSMITNGELQWWHKNLSFLGTNLAQNAWQFNLTLIISALLMIALVDVLFISLQKSFPKNHRLFYLRILLTLTALSLGGVGLFPNNGAGRLHELHTKAANWLVYLIIILIISCYFLLPNVTKEFLAISYSMATSLIVANLIFKRTTFLSLTAFELIAFILGFSWLLLLLQNLLNLLKTPSKIYTFKIIEE